MTPSDKPGADGEHIRYRNEGLRALLAHFTVGNADTVLTLRDILATLQQSGFGVFLFVAVLPAFIPIPGLAGALSGPLVMLVGLQMLFGLRRPWLPRFIGERGPRRSTTRRFIDKVAPLLRWLDRALRPRLTMLVAPLPARLFSGLLVALTGLLLSLPIPFTNYLFGLLLLLFALALLERDGALMLLCWIAAGTCLVLSGITSEQLLDLFQQWWAKLH